MLSDVAIEAKGITKNYDIYDKPAHRLLQGLFGNKKKFGRTFTALKDVSFEVKKGETVGIIGRNGAGKSTLLEIICGTVAPTSGEVEVAGRVAALLELGAGFNREFTGKENIYMNATLLGMSRKEIEERYDDIVDFAGIGGFIDQPVKTYSSGMYVRLAFSVAISADPDILIVDEALAVGDSAFQRKCFARIQEIQQKGGVILFVSHSISAILELCNKAILLDEGELILLGTPKLVVSNYEKLVYAPVEKIEKIRAEIVNHHSVDDADPGPCDSETASSDKDVAGDQNEKFNVALTTDSSVEYESRGAVIENVRIEALDGTLANVLSVGDQYLFKYDIYFSENAKSVRFGMLIKTVTGVEVGGLLSHPSTDGIRHVQAGDRIETVFTFKCLFNSGDYFYNAGVSGIVGGQWSILHRIVDAGMFTIRHEEGLLTAGILDISTGKPCVWSRQNENRDVNLYGRRLTQKEIAENYHREYVGGMWDSIGALQYEFLVAQGLEPTMNLVDIGCGSLRGGLHFIRYLTAGNYYGIDSNKSLLDAGYHKELAEAGMTDKLPEDHLLEESDFRVSRFGTQFDIAIAMSLFTHLPMDRIRLCLVELSQCMKKGGKFYATYFESPPDKPIAKELEYYEGFMTYADKDPYHYRYEDICKISEDLPWEVLNVGEWGHPRNQHMLCFSQK